MCQQKASRATSPLRAPCWRTLASGEVVQMDYDEEMGPLHGMYGSMEAEVEVQRTIKRMELTAFLCFLKKVCGPIKVHGDNKGRIDGLRKGEKECIKPRAGHAVLWITFWEELHELIKRGILVEGSGTCQGTPNEERKIKDDKNRKVRH